MTPKQIRNFVKSHANLSHPSLVAELKLWLADESTELWHATETALNSINLPPPFWAFAWPGGQAIARFIIDNPELIFKKRILDFGAGGGICSLAAAYSGSKEVVAVDLDPFAAIVQSMNSEANSLKIETVTQNASELTLDNFDIILAGDVFYDRTESRIAVEFLLDAVKNGITVFIGDPGRTYLPDWLKTPIANYSVPTSKDLEQKTVTVTNVWMITNKV